MRGRRWARGFAAGAGGLLLALAPLAAPAPAAADGGDDLVAACEPLTAIPEVGPRACKSLEAGTWLMAQGCRRVDGLKEPLCPIIDGRPVHESAMQDYEAGWLARALALQRQLDLDVPLTQALFPHTHNAANSGAYAPSVSTLDANQVLTLTDQLRLGMRAIEIDIHWTPNPEGDPAQGYRAVVQCHGEPVATPVGTLHAGCSVDMLLVDLLAELRAWLDQPANHDEVVLLYLENALDGDDAAHAAAVAAIEATIGDLVARPVAGAGCQPLPVTRSKQDLLDAGTRLLVTGNCGPSGWTDWVFERGPAWDESGGSRFDCAAERASLDFESTLIRRYEDSTWLSAMAGSGSHRDATTIAEMVRCGVNLVGFDQVHPGDDRLPGLVWSWRVDEPAATSTGACAAVGDDGRFFADDCSVPHRVACRTAAGSWALTPDPTAWASGEDACRAAGHAGAGVPFNGWDSGALHALVESVDAGEVWLAYAQDADGAWVTGIPASEPLDDAPGHSEDRPADPRGHGGPPTDPGDARGKPIASSRPEKPAPLPLAGALAAAVAVAAMQLVVLRHRKGDLAPQVAGVGVAPPPT